MERAFDREMADLISGFTSDLGKIVKAVLAENRRLISENARLTAKLQGVRDQVADVPDTLPTVDEIAARGSAHQAVNEDIEERAIRLGIGATPARALKTSNSLSELLNKLRNLQAEPLPEFPDEPHRVNA